MKHSETLELNNVIFFYLVLVTLLLQLKLHLFVSEQSKISVDICKDDDSRIRSSNTSSAWNPANMGTNGIGLRIGGISKRQSGMH